jgi:hypothetical protein
MGGKHRAGNVSWELGVVSREARQGEEGISHFVRNDRLTFIRGDRGLSPAAKGLDLYTTIEFVIPNGAKRNEESGLKRCCK